MHKNSPYVKHFPITNEGCNHYSYNEVGGYTDSIIDEVLAQWNCVIVLKDVLEIVIKKKERKGCLGRKTLAMGR